MILIQNRKAKQEYEILAKFEAGLVLIGSEVKSLRLKQGSLRGSYVKIVGNQVFLIGAQVNPYKFAQNNDYDPKRTRKLLLHKREIKRLQILTQIKGRTLVPLSISLRNNKIKLNFAVGRGKKKYEKRAELKSRAIEKDIRREIKTKIRVS